MVKFRMIFNKLRRWGIRIAAALALFHPSQRLLAQTSTLSLSSAAGNAGTPVILNLSLSGSGTPAGIQWTFAYSPTQISAVAVSAGPVATAAGKTISCASLPGAINCLLIGINANTIAPGVAATVQVTLASNAATAAVSLANAIGVDATGTGLTVALGTSGTIVPSLISGVACSPASVGGGGVGTCTVEISQPAPPGGASITLGSSNALLTVPGAVTIAAGASTAIFSATASTSIPADQNATVTATFGSSSQTAIISLHALPQTIGPVIRYATYDGGSSDDIAFATATDAAGNTYIAGSTASTDFPATAGAYKTSNQGGASDIFVSKIDPTGALVYATYIGGSGQDVAHGIAVDSSGDVYITGYTTSTDFPVTTGAYRSTYQGGASDAFLVELNAAGSGLVYSTYLGGSGADIGWGIALDGSNEPTVTGSTASTDFPVTGGAYKTTNGGGIADAFVARLNAAGTTLAYSTYLGGSGEDVGYGIALDTGGNAYVTGYTQSSDYPTTAGVAQGTIEGNYDAFVTAVNPTGTALLYSTYLGGSNQDYGLGIAVDSGGSAYVTGYTNSSDYPHTAGVIQSATAGGYDALVTKLTSAGALAYSTFIGGSGDDHGRAIAVDGSGDAYITGDTASADFPSVRPVQTGLNGAGDAFVASLNVTGTTLNYSTWLGGSGLETGYGIALDAARTAYVAGSALSADFPVTAGAAQPVWGGGSDAFLVKLSGTPSLTIAKSHTGNFGQGQNGATYTVSVANAGLGATSGTVTVMDSMPAGLTATGMGGPGWACTLATLTCTRSDVLNPATGYAPITVTVNVAANAAAQVTNQASVAGGGSPGAMASDATAVNITVSQNINFGALVNEALGAGPLAIDTTDSSGLTVTLVSNSVSVCTVSGTTVTLVAAGICSITASQAGNASYAAAAPVTQTFAVGLTPQTITFAALNNVAPGAAPFSLSATADSGLPVIFASNTPVVCTVLGDTVTILVSGGCSISAIQPGDGMTYAPAAPVTRSFTVLFSDVSPDDLLFAEVNAFAQYGITSGCALDQFCPADNVARDQMAIFIVRAIFGGDNFTYSATPYFTDVTPATFGFKWIQKLKDLGITSGCTATTYCPSEVVTRDQMAVFIIRARLGVSIAGPNPTFTYPSTSYFTDATAGNEFAFPWIQRMRLENITSGCTATTYCSSSPVTREEMAAFIMRGAFNEFLPAGTPVLAQISPSILPLGTSGTYTITGVNTNFVQGTTQISPIPGVTIGTITVTSPTTMTVELTAASDATPQPCSVLAITGSEQDVLPNGLVLQ